MGGFYNAKAGCNRVRDRAKTRSCAAWHACQNFITLLKKSLTSKKNSLVWYKRSRASFSK